ncbi:MAG: T9SS type A sorting domain-containing protein [Bacteroidetes bacterium]|nr:T9SS type A sorting domain-containing protein [Bacteroidota bacterium]
MDKTFPGGSYSSCTSVTTDLNGNVFIGGTFLDSIDCDPGPNFHTYISTVHANQGEYDSYIIKLNANGQYIWSVHLDAGTYSTAVVMSLATDNNGSLCSTGTFSGTIDFDPSGTTHNLLNMAPAATSMFMYQLDSNGNYLWAKSISAGVASSGNDILTDESNNIYICGDFGDGSAPTDSFDFDLSANQYYLHGSGYMKTFIMKLNSSGVFRWALETGNSTSGLSGNAYSSSMARDINGNLYVNGNFENSIDVNTGSATTNISSNGGFDTYLFKLDSTGAFQWARSFGGSAFWDFAYSTNVDRFGNVYLTGGFAGSVDFDPGFANQIRTSVGGGVDCYLLKLDPGGNYRWVQTFTGTSSNVNNQLAIDNDNIIMSGHFVAQFDADPGVGTTIFNNPSSQSQMFILKLQVTVTDVNDNSSPSFALYPNPCTEVFQIKLNNSSQETVVDIFDVTGKKIYEDFIEREQNAVTINDLRKGMYFVRLTQKKVVVPKKLSYNKIFTPAKYYP